MDIFLADIIDIINILLISIFYPLKNLYSLAAVSGLLRTDIKLRIIIGETTKEIIKEIIGVG